MFWLILFVLLLIMAVGGTVYLFTRFHRFSFMEKFGEKHKLLSWLACLIPLGGLACFGFINFYTVIVVVLHLIIFWLIADIIAAIVRKAAKKQRRRNIEGAAAILFTAVYLALGWHNAHDVRRTAYELHTDKPLAGGSLRIAAIADPHLGITLNGDDFAREMERIQAEKPDILVIAGDYVDDDSCREDMVRSCEALGKLDTKYGVYFIFGNHDKGYFEGYRDFTADDLREELKKNNVTILEDESVEIAEGLTLIGRQDKSDESRMEMSDLAKDMDAQSFNFILDHQPNDYANEAESGADLVFSGHTHGGHIWPAGQIGLLLGANDRVYGTEKRGNTEFIVTSGISGWAIPFKTGTFSEYVIIDVKN